jgi:hypothetical protein
VGVEDPNYYVLSVSYETIGGRGGGIGDARHDSSAFCIEILHHQGLDTSTTAGKAMFQMLGMFAEFERVIIRERVNAGWRGREQRGRIWAGVRSGLRWRPVYGSLRLLGCVSRRSAAPSAPPWSNEWSLQLNSRRPRLPPCGSVPLQAGMASKERRRG